jgi:hypothetical protein
LILNYVRLFVDMNTYRIKTNLAKTDKGPIRANRPQVVNSRWPI